MVDEIENQINHLEYKEAKNNHAKQQEEKSIPQKAKHGINSLWDNFKRSNILLIGVPKGKENEQEIRNLSEKNSGRKLP